MKTPRRRKKERKTHSIKNMATKSLKYLIVGRKKGDVKVELASPQTPSFNRNVSIPSIKL